MRPIDYIDSGAPDSEICEVTQGDLRAWHDEIEGLNDQFRPLDRVATALLNMMQINGKPHRDAWLNDQAYEAALLCWERARVALDGLER